MNLTDVILLILVIALVIFCGKKGMGHFKGESGCCGGGGSTIIEDDKKLDGDVIGKCTIDVEGMSCSNCEARVKRAINSVDHASGSVNLKKGEAVVSYDQTIDINEVIKKIEKAGYKAKVR